MLAVVVCCLEGGLVSFKAEAGEIGNNEIKKISRMIL
jgi:hypothetical protein